MHPAVFNSNPLSKIGKGQTEHMVCVVEYGENIGTLKNLFPELAQAVAFAHQIIARSSDEYECVGPHQWYCAAKKEYVRIENK